MPKPAAAVRRPALALFSAALACAAALAAAAPAAHADDPKKEPPPPAVMSAVGGDLLALPGTQVRPQAGVPALPAKLTSRSWVVADAETGAVLAAHNAHWPLAPASTLKMLFADTVLPKFSSTTRRKVAPSDLRDMGDGSSLVGIKENLTYTVHDLWLGVFLRSGNDAVHVLSAMNGGIDQTVQDMNRQAKELQADDTHVVSPDGYDMPGQVSSAYDLTLFARSGLQNPDFRAYCSTVSAQFPGDFKRDTAGRPTRTRESFAIQNTDRLLTGDYGLPRYPGIAGVKNGYTSNAGNTYTAVAQHGDRTLLVTVMHPSGPGRDLSYKEAAALLDWGFKAAPAVKPVGTLVPPRSARQPAGSSATGGGPKGPAQAAAVSASGGMWTAATVTAGSLLVIGALAFAVRRRWPRPSGVRRAQG